MNKRKIFFSILAIIIVLIGFFYLNKKDKIFIVIEDKMGNVLTVIPTHQEFSTIYIHSSEKQPWENIYKINNDNTFTLMTMKVRSLGPGVPYNIEEGWKFYIKDGFFIYDNINQKFNLIDIKLSSISPHFIKANEEMYNLVDICGDNADIKITVEKGIHVDIRRFFTWMILESKKL